MVNAPQKNNIMPLNQSGKLSVFISDKELATDGIRGTLHLDLLLNWFLEPSRLVHLEQSFLRAPCGG